MRGTTVVALSLAIVVAGAAATPSPAGQDLPTRTARPIVGRWGGDRARLDATATGARLQVDCLVARLEKPIAIDEAGRFVVAVTFAPLRGVNLAGRERHPPSTVTGRIERDTLHLTIEPADADGAGTFALTRNGRAKLPELPASELTAAPRAVASRARRRGRSPLVAGTLV